MQFPYRFKLHPSKKQNIVMLDWQHKIGYIQNRSLGDRIWSYNRTLVFGNYCDLHTKREINTEFLYCDIETKTLTSPLHCSVNKSSSLGNPWKEDKPSLRRGKKDKPFNPKRSAYEMHSAWVTEYKKQNSEYKGVSADVIQQSLRHVDKAFSSFFAGLSGFPKFKKHKDVGFEFKPGDVKISENFITFPVLGTMKFFKSRNIPESWEIRTATISREVDGWYVSVRLRDDTVPNIPTNPLEKCQTIQGADVGIKKLVALSDGTMIANPQFLKKNERRLAIRQRRVSRKQPGSNKYKKSVKQLSRTHQRIRRQREDYLWKSAKKVASNADITVLEDLNVKGMKSRCKPKLDPVTGKYIKNGQAAKSALNKAISDASWYSLKLKIKHQASKLGNLVIEVDPKFTSQKCPECHHTSKANRNKEKFVCEECGYSDDADTNGAVNIATRGKQKLGIGSLRVVSPKVTPKEPAQQEASDVSRSEPGNPAKSTVKRRQLLLLKVKSTPVQPKSRTKSQRKVPNIQCTQLTLFDSFDWDAKKSTS